MIATNFLKVDTREPVNEIKEIMVNSKYWDLTLVNFEAMHLGDYEIVKNGKSLLIERKEMSDLITSIFSKGSSKGSLKQKLFQMQSMADRTALLIEGNYSLKYGKVYINPFVPKIPYNIVARFIDHRRNEGVDIIHTYTFEETIFRLYLMLTDKADFSPCKLKSIDQIMLAFPKIGTSGLEKLKKKYSSPRDAFLNIDKWIKQIDLDRW